MPAMDRSLAMRMAFERTNLHACQANSRSACSLLVGLRAETTFQAAGSSTELSEVCTSAPPDMVLTSVWEQDAGPTLSTRVRLRALRASSASGS